MRNLRQTVRRECRPRSGCVHDVAALRRREHAEGRRRLAGIKSRVVGGSE